MALSRQKGGDSSHQPEVCRPYTLLIYWLREGGYVAAEDSFKRDLAAYHRIQANELIALVNWFSFFYLLPLLHRFLPGSGAFCVQNLPPRKTMEDTSFR